MLISSVIHIGSTLRLLKSQWVRVRFVKQENVTKFRSVPSFNLSNLINKHLTPSSLQSGDGEREAAHHPSDRARILRHSQASILLLTVRITHIMQQYRVDVLHFVFIRYLKVSDSPHAPKSFMHGEWDCCVGPFFLLF